jgi:hypothetical protein
MHGGVWLLSACPLKWASTTRESAAVEEVDGIDRYRSILVLLCMCRLVHPAGAGLSLRGLAASSRNSSLHELVGYVCEAVHGGAVHVGCAGIVHTLWYIRMYLITWSECGSRVKCLWSDMAPAGSECEIW